ncbi:MAG: hypothetical protein Q9224_007407, partial [Gallowayella concinna]
PSRLDEGRPLNAVRSSSDSERPSSTASARGIRFVMDVTPSVIMKPGVMVGLGIVATPGTTKAGAAEEVVRPDWLEEGPLALEDLLVELEVFG